MAKTLLDFGIFIKPGETRSACPRCSPGRKKKYDKCLAVDQGRGVWFCHHCGWHGAVGETGEDRTAKPLFVEAEIKDERVLAWFKQRGISAATLNAFHVKAGRAWMHGPDGGGETNTIQFPYYCNGQVVNIKYRTGDKRFRQEKSARKCFYNYDMAMQSNSRTLIITEGEMDCLALYECGYFAVVSVPDGAPNPESKTFAAKFNFLQGAEPLFEKFQHVVLAVDDDSAGKKLESELCRRIGMNKCKQVVWPEGCKDANDVLQNHGAEALQRCIDNAAWFPVDGVQTVETLWDAVFALHASPQQPGAHIGWDNAAFNVEPGQMTVVTGIPSHGKSTFIDALRVNLFQLYGWPSAAFSPENWPARDHLALLAEMYSGRHFRDMTVETLYSVMLKIKEAFFFIQPEKDEDLMTVAAILARAKTLVYRNGIKVLVIDPWNEIDHAIPAGQREDQYIGAQLAKIRRFARVNAVHVFLIVHPRLLEKNKQGNYPPPTAYDISGGSMWRNKADNILCVYRPDMKTSNTEVYVQKIRFRRNGKAGAIMKFKFHVSTSSYHAQKEN